MGTCGNGWKVGWWLAGRQSSAAVRRQVLPPPPVSLPLLLLTHSSLQHPLQAEECASLRRVVLAERRHLRRAPGRRGLPSGAAPRALIRADVKWVWALQEGPGEDEEGARCAAGALRPWRALSPGAADAWPARLAEPAHAAAELPAPGRLPRRPWGLAGTAAGDLQVCSRAITFGGLWAVGSAGCTGCIGRGGVLLCLVAGVGSGLVPGRPSAWEPQRVAGVSQNSLSCAGFRLLLGKGAEGAALF